MMRGQRPTVAIKQHATVSRCAEVQLYDLVTWLRLRCSEKSAVEERPLTVMAVATREPEKTALMTTIAHKAMVTNWVCLRRIQKEWEAGC
jgi:hypothetical protein